MLSSKHTLSSRVGGQRLASSVSSKRFALPKRAAFALAAGPQEGADSTQKAQVNPVYEIAARRKSEPEVVTTVQAPAPPPPPPSKNPLTSPAAIAAGLVVAAAGTKYILDTPSRKYQPGENTVGKEYNDWTDEGVLEYYWGEHIHLGYYTDEELAAGYKNKDFIDAKKDFVYEMLKWADPQNSPKTILDCGCGIGGTSRLLAKKFPNAKVIGITLSDSQVRRGTELAAEQGLTNVEFRVMNALEMEFEDNSIDFVWACESGEHMPDKTAYVNEMVRVLKPGGNLAVATWCQREETPETPLTQEDKDNLQFLYDEWAHPYFISFEEYARIMERTGAMEKVSGEDWVKNTLASWRHSIWVGVYDPWPVVFRGPWVWYKTVREIVTLERMHRAFDRGLMTYGMIKGTKKPVEATETVAERPSMVRA